MRAGICQGALLNHRDDDVSESGEARVTPINPARLDAPFDHEDFVFELKHDGFLRTGHRKLVSKDESMSC